MEPSDKKNLIRTYATDIEQTVRERQTSLVDIAAAEQKKRDQQTYVKEEQTRSKRSIILVIGAGLLLLAGIVIGIVAWLKFGAAPAADTIIEQNKFIFVNYSRNVDLTGLDRDRIIKTINQEIGENTSPLGSVTEFIFSEVRSDINKRINSERLIALMNSKAPAEFLKSIGSEYLFGIHTFDGDQPFVIIRVSNYSSAFSGMLKYENNIASDLPFFFRKINNMDSTVEDPELAGTSKFTDLIVANRDARAIRDINEKIRMIYSFPDRDTLVITTNENTLKEIFDRLSSTQFIK